RGIVSGKYNCDETVTTSELLGALFTISLQNAYYPRHERSLGDTMNRFAGALGSDATSNILREFWPDIRRIFRKHAPEKVRKIEEKVTSQIPCSITPPENTGCR